MAESKWLVYEHSVYLGFPGICGQLHFADRAITS